MSHEDYLPWIFLKKDYLRFLIIQSVSLIRKCFSNLSLFHSPDRFFPLLSIPISFLSPFRTVFLRLITISPSLFLSLSFLLSLSLYLSLSLTPSVTHSLCHIRSHFFSLCFSSLLSFLSLYFYSQSIFSLSFMIAFRLECV